jgi:hypothetical protein
MNKNRVFFAITLLCFLSAAFGQNVSTSTPNGPAVSGNGSSVQVTAGQVDEQPTPDESAKPDKITASPSFKVLIRLQKEASKLAQEIKDYQRFVVSGDKPDFRNAAWNCRNRSSKSK